MLSATVPGGAGQGMNPGPNASAPISLTSSVRGYIGGVECGTDRRAQEALNDAVLEMKMPGLNQRLTLSVCLLVF